MQDIRTILPITGLERMSIKFNSPGTRGYDCSFTAKEKLKHIVSKEAFNIDGLGKKVIDQFWDLKLIKIPSDIFELNYNKISNLEGWGDTSIKNLKQAEVRL